LGIYLVLPCLVAQWMLAAHSRRRLTFWAAGFALVVCLYAMARTQTFSALAALALGSAVFWWVLLPRRKALLVGGAGLIVAAVLLAGVGPLRTRVGKAIDFAQRGEVNTLLSGRLDGWRAAVSMLREHPATGVGHGAFLPEFAPAKLKLLERGVPFFAGHVQPMFANAHGEILNVAAEWGIPGLLALTWALWLLAAELRRGGPPRPDLALAWAGTGALAVVALTYFPFRMALVAYPALLFLAWVFARVQPREQG
jgi:O-antigen ligase